MHPTATSTLPAPADNIRSTVSTEPTEPRPRAIHRLGRALRRVFSQHDAAHTTIPLPTTTLPEHHTRSEIRDAQIRDLGFHTRLC